MTTRPTTNLQGRQGSATNPTNCTTSSGLRTLCDKSIHIGYVATAIGHPPSAMTPTRHVHRDIRRSRPIQIFRLFRGASAYNRLALSPCKLRSARWWICSSYKPPYSLTGHVMYTPLLIRSTHDTQYSRYGVTPNRSGCENGGSKDSERRIELTACLSTLMRAYPHGSFDNDNTYTR